MPKFRAAVMTDAGASLMAAAFAEGFQMEFVKMLIGSGKYEENEKTVEALKKRTDLKSKRQEVGFSSTASAKENVIQLKALVTNENLDEGYHMTEIAVIAKKAGEGEPEILYSIAIADEADYLPPKESPIEIIQEFYTKVSNTEKVSINLNMSTVALAEDVEKIINPSFEEANTRENIKKKDNYFTILGKIKKFFTDLKTIAFTGSYNDLENKPDIPAAVAVKGNAEKNYRTGNVNLTPDNIGALPIGGDTAENITTFSTTSARENLKSGEKHSILFGKIAKWLADLKKVAFSGNYNDLSNKPTIPTVVNNNTTTEAGYALDARQANPNVDGSLAKQISTLNSSLVNLYRTQVITDGWSIVSVNGVNFITLVNGCFIHVSDTKCDLHLDILLRDNFGIYAGVAPHTQMLNMDALKGWIGITSLSFEPLQTAACVILGTTTVNDYDEKKLLRVEKYWDSDFTGLHLTTDGRLTRRYYNGSIVYGNIPVCANAGETLPPIMHQGNVIHVDIYGATYS